MKFGPGNLLRSFLFRTKLELLPVRVRSGVAEGARWTLCPWSAYWRGTHEPAIQSAVLSLGDIQGWNCWDLGAHFGIYSVGLARRVGPTGSVAAFEPNPACFARLSRHRRMNRLDWLHLFQAATSDVSGSAELYNYGGPRATTAHLPYENETRVAAASPFRVSTVALDELVSDGQLLPPHFVKIDIEGHAHRAVLGARHTIAAHRPLLIVAFHSEPEVSGVLSVLGPLGYTSEKILPHSFSQDAMIGRDFWFRPPK